MNLLDPTSRKRALFFVACDYIVFVASLYGAFLIRFEGRIPSTYLAAISTYVMISLVPKFASNAAFRLYRLTWRFVGARDVLNVLFATVVGTLGFATLAFFLRGSLELPGLPRSVLLLDFLLTFVGVGGVRMFKRIWMMLTERGRSEQEAKRLLIVGAGRTGDRLLRDITTRRMGYRPVGLVDDDPMKQDSFMHGIPVLGDRSDLDGIVRDERVQEVIVAMPSAPGAVIREVVVAVRAAGVESVRILPGVDDLLEGRIALASVREVKVEDLLGREPVDMDTEAVGGYLYGATVLVTGAAGSVGAELVRQILRFEPGRLILVEKDETRLFGLDLDLRRSASPVALFPVVADVRDRDRMRQVFSTFHPQVVFHAAAYKHVPMMEAHPQEAVLNNIGGTASVAQVASEAGSALFVLVSTDKAVNPTSVMGATKRVAEMVVRRLNETSATRFEAVRFGNVLGSRGSLLPILQKQIRRGGPITVTDPEMERYFMTLTEAARLILTAASIGSGGEVFTLDMGDPVRVVDLVEALIRMSGLEPDVDVPIQFTGVRPGEKLKEELVLAEEGIVATSREEIFVARLGTEPDPAALERQVGLLMDAARDGDPTRIRVLLQETVRTYHPTPGATSEEMFAELLEGDVDPDADPDGSGDGSSLRGDRGFGPE